MEKSEKEIKKGFELILKRYFNLSDESIKLIYEMVESKKISISNLQRKLKLGYSRAAAIFDNVIYLYAPQLIQNIENAIDNKLFNINKIVFMDRGEFRQLQKIGNLFEICKNTENEYEFEIINTEKFRGLCEIILCLDFKLDYREKFLKTN